MAVTKDELDRFNQFAVAAVELGKVVSLEQLVTLWRTRQRQEVNVAIREGLTEADAELGCPLEEFMSEFRDRNQVSPSA